MRVSSLSGCLCTAIACMLGVAAGTARAEVMVYQATSTGYLGNYIPFGADGTPGRPAGDHIGNTVTFDSALWASNQELISARILLDNEIGGGLTYTLDLYSGSDPNTGALLASDTVAAPHWTNLVEFDLNVYVPQTVTFIVSASSGSNFHAGAINTNPNGPEIGSADNSLWYGSGSPDFVANSTWAKADGAATNYIYSEFTAEAPEPSAIFLLGTVIAVLGIGLIKARRKAHA
jgi:hypothetical protein